MLLAGLIIAHQTFGDMLRWNPHFHAIVLEVGFDEHGRFFYIPFNGLQAMLELFSPSGDQAQERLAKTSGCSPKRASWMRGPPVTY